MDVVPELLLEVLLDFLNLGGGDPSVHDVGVLADCKAQRDGSLLDLDSKLLVRSLEERSVLLFKLEQLYLGGVDILDGLGDLRIDLGDLIGRRNGLAGRNLQLCESDLGQRGGDSVPAGVAEEYGHDTSVLLVVGREDLGIEVKRGRVGGNGADQD